MGVIYYAVPYVRWRSLGMLPVLFSVTGFAAYQELLNTVTPLKLSLITNLLNIFLDALCIFGLSKSGLTVSGSVLLGMLWTGLCASDTATALSISELTSSLIYLRLLIRRKIIQLNKLFKPSSMASILPLIKG